MAANRSKEMFGKYRGKVLDNLDPLVLGRIVAEVPALGASQTNWALPCSPYAGPQVGFYAVPPIGANVWIEFEGGDLNYPIWTGCFWAGGELPMLAGQLPSPFTKILKTEGVSMVMSDLPGAGGLMIECLPPTVAEPLRLHLTLEGIELGCGTTTIQLTPELITFVAAQISATGEFMGQGATLTGGLCVTGAIEAGGGLDIVGAATVNGAPIV